MTKPDDDFRQGRQKILQNNPMQSNPFGRNQRVDSAWLQTYLRISEGRSDSVFATVVAWRRTDGSKRDEAAQ
jgi:hypothetical protein